MTISILSLHTYPVKSCCGITHTQVSVTPGGLAHDRQWVVADEHGVFLSQRSQPRMALVQPALDETALFLNAPEMPTLRVSLRKGETAADATPLSIGHSLTLGLDEGDTAAHWFSDYLGRACRLYRVHPNAHRLVAAQDVTAWRETHPEAEGFPQEHPLGFADAFPFNIVNQASLDDLNARLVAAGHPPAGLLRFRPNIVIQGLQPYEEDELCSLHVGDLTFAAVSRAARCTMINVDPATGESGVEPLATLSAYRCFEERVLFGLNAVVAGVSRGTVLSVGDRVLPVHEA